MEIYEEKNIESVKERESEQKRNQETKIKTNVLYVKENLQYKK